jgi:hypothetical protein
MKKTLLLTLIVFIFSLDMSAQADTIRLKDMGSGGPIVTDRPPQAVYFQLGGSGPILSVNYDRRFSKKLNGAGFAVGLGYWHSWGVGAVSVPVSLNYLFGRRSHFIEAAAGTTFISASTFDWMNEDNTESGFFHHINLGYRHQPATGGFFFRGGFSPLFYGGESAVSFYLGFGYNF